MQGLGSGSEAKALPAKTEFSPGREMITPSCPLNCICTNTQIIKQYYETFNQYYETLNKKRVSLEASGGIVVLGLQRIGIKILDSFKAIVKVKR